MCVEVLRIVHDLGGIFPPPPVVKQNKPKPCRTVYLSLISSSFPSNTGELAVLGTELWAKDVVGSRHSLGGTQHIANASEGQRAYGEEKGCLSH